MAKVKIVEILCHAAALGRSALRVRDEANLSTDDSLFSVNETDAFRIRDFGFGIFPKIRISKSEFPNH